MRRTVGGVAMMVMAAALAVPASSTVAPPNPNAVKSKLVAEALLLGVTRAGKRLVSVGEYGNILLSDDDGKTWRQASLVPTTVTLTAVHFVDDKTGWAVGHDTVVIKTVDGGDNWAKQYGGGESDNALLSVYFKDVNHGWAVGAFNYTVETTDAGKTWVERKTLMPPPAPGSKPAAAPVAPVEDVTAPVKPVDGADPFAAAEGDENHLNAMFAGPDENTLFVAAEAGAIYRSLDAGATWEKILTGYGGSFWGGLTAKDGTVYATGMRGNIWRSTDKGKTWAKLDTSGADQSIATGIQLPDGSFVFVGLGGQVLYSADGQKFTLTYRADRKGLNAVAVDGADRLLVFGEAGVKDQSLTPRKEDIDVPLPAAAPAG
ncbi:MAG: YCF48-related protein [Vicinamibacterales bacterium]